MKKVAIVIPFHKKTLSEGEKTSLKHLTHFLDSYDKFLVLPEKITKSLFTIPKAKIIHLPSEYFESVPKYCEMLNTYEFNGKFKDYEYILIYQLDVLVFKDELMKWCNSGYDYIGPPFQGTIGELTRLKNSQSSGCNGGFSLRNVKKFLKVIELTKKEAKRSSKDPKIRKSWFIKAVLSGKSHKKWLNARAEDYPFNEDGFWSYEAPKYDSTFKVAPFDKALQFGFERQPRKCFKLNGNILPFGCHAWEKYDKTFWESYILK